MGEKTITITVDEWLELCRREGFAAGLLTGWLHSTPEGQDRCREATRKFLDERHD